MTDHCIFKANSKMALPRHRPSGIFPDVSGPGSRDPGAFRLGTWDSQSILARVLGSQMVWLRETGNWEYKSRLLSVPEGLQIFLGLGTVAFFVVCVLFTFRPFC